MTDGNDLISREVLLKHRVSAPLSFKHADPNESAGYNFILGFHMAREQIAEIIKAEPAVERERIIHCCECQHCHPFQLADGFFCKAWQTDFYSPPYDPATYFCADAKPKEGAASA